MLPLKILHSVTAGFTSVNPTVSGAVETSATQG